MHRHMLLIREWRESCLGADGLHVWRQQREKVVGVDICVTILLRDCLL